MTKFRLKVVGLIFMIGLLELNSIQAANLNCLPSTCKNNGICSEEPNGFKCNCSPEFTGTHCELRSEVEADCLNNGYMLNGECMCSAGFRGKQCQFQFKSFKLTRSGQLGSVCLNNGYQPREGLPCKCPDGFYGSLCEYMNNNMPPSDNISACVRIPCRNGGICTPTKYGSYACICRNGFYGQNCGNLLYRRTYGGFGSLLPFLIFFSLVTMFVYCCCFKKNRTFQASNIFSQRAEAVDEAIRSHPQYYTNNLQSNQTNPTVYAQPNQFRAEATPKINADLPPSYDDVVQKPTNNNTNVV